ncbi:hypothetical protein D3C86_1441450 [compost metagenome]
MCSPDAPKTFAAVYRACEADAIHAPSECLDSDELSPQATAQKSTSSAEPGNTDVNKCFGFFIGLKRPIYGAEGERIFLLRENKPVTRMTRSSTTGLLARPPPEGNRLAGFRARTSKSSGHHTVSPFGFYVFDPNVPAKHIWVEHVESSTSKEIPACSKIPSATTWYCKPSTRRRTLFARS